jgi:pimeloyl-ACP methyl ester carboxylesterase
MGRARRGDRGGAPRRRRGSPTRVLPELAATGIPVLLLRATKPAEYEPMRAQALARSRSALPAAEIIEVDAGHALLTEAGPEGCRTLVDWIDRGD